MPLLEAPPLARALYHNVDLNREIPGALYGAVAQVLAWVYQLRRFKTTAASRRTHRPISTCRRNSTRAASRTTKPIRKPPTHSLQPR